MIHQARIARAALGPTSASIMTPTVPDPQTRSCDPAVGRGGGGGRGAYKRSMNFPGSYSLMWPGAGTPHAKLRCARGSTNARYPCEDPHKTFHDDVLLRTPRFALSDSGSANATPARLTTRKDPGGVLRFEADIVVEEHKRCNVNDVHECLWQINETTLAERKRNRRRIGRKHRVPKAELAAGTKSPLNATTALPLEHPGGLDGHCAETRMAVPWACPAGAGRPMALASAERRKDC